MAFSKLMRRPVEMQLDKIDSEYDPNFDNFSVSWADKALLEAVRELTSALLETQAKVTALEGQLEAVTRAVNGACKRCGESFQDGAGGFCDLCLEETGPLDEGEPRIVCWNCYQMRPNQAGPCPKCSAEFMTDTSRRDFTELPF